MTIVIQIGNTDNKLSQQEWYSFVQQMKFLVEDNASEVHGMFFSDSWAPWQNACFVFDRKDSTSRTLLKSDIASIGKRWDQDSIAYMESETEFLTVESAAQESDQSRSEPVDQSDNHKYEGYKFIAQEDIRAGELGSVDLAIGTIRKYRQ